MKNETLEILTKPAQNRNERDNLIWWVAELIVFNRKGAPLQMGAIAAVVHAYLIVWAKWGFLDPFMLTPNAISRIANTVQEIIIYRLTR